MAHLYSSLRDHLRWLLNSIRLVTRTLSQNGRTGGASININVSIGAGFCAGRVCLGPLHDSQRYSPSFVTATGPQLYSSSLLVPSFINVNGVLRNIILY